MKKIKEVISFCYGNDVVRYVFFGGCTTLVNLAILQIYQCTSSDNGN